MTDKCLKFSATHVGGVRHGNSSQPEKPLFLKAQIYRFSLISYICGIPSREAGRPQAGAACAQNADASQPVGETRLSFGTEDSNPRISNHFSKNSNSNSARSNAELLECAIHNILNLETSRNCARDKLAQPGVRLSALRTGAQGCLQPIDWQRRTIMNNFPFMEFSKQGAT